MNAAVIWITGVPAAGKTTLAEWLRGALREQGAAVVVLDGDALRSGVNRDLGFSAADRAEAARRAAAVAALLAAQGTTAVVSMVSPVRGDRAAARETVRAADVPWLEVHVDTPLATCRERDPKGLYARAAAGELRGLTGWDEPYETPTADEALRVDGTAATPGRLVLEALRPLLEGVAGPIR